MTRCIFLVKRTEDCAFNGLHSAANKIHQINRTRLEWTRNNETDSRICHAECTMSGCKEYIVTDKKCRCVVPFCGSFALVFNEKHTRAGAGHANIIGLV